MEMATQALVNALFAALANQLSELVLVSMRCLQTTRCYEKQMQVAAIL